MAPTGTKSAPTAAPAASTEKIDRKPTAGGRAFQYRADVDGLRAVAVVLVLLFHAGFGFSGGYVGVDVFFVISGYLITGLILAQQDRGTFRLAEFWNRRLRRIVPASSCVVVVTLAAGGFLLLPSDLQDLGESAIYQQLMVSNHYFWHHTGYFDGPADLKPLLHTWSLAVEEQFYLIYPLILVALGGCSRRQRLAVLLVGLSLSFALAAWLVLRHPGATFYALPTRAWELLLGGILAAGPIALGVRRRWHEFTALAGMSLILYAAWQFDGQTVFPGPAALLPCLGTALIITAGTGQRPIVNRLLATKPLVMIGVLSYSLYLWHWPLLVFQRYWYGDQVSILSRGMILVVSVILAWLSWRWIETPCRCGPRWTSLSTPRVVAATGLSAAILILTAHWIWANRGLPSRVPQNVLTIVRDASRPDDLKAMDREAADCDRDNLPTIGVADQAQPIRFLLWGDSHARAISKLCDQLCREQGIRGALAIRSGTSPLDHYNKTSAAWNEAVLRYIGRHQVQHVLLVSRWRGSAPDAAAGERLETAMRKTYAALREQGIRVHVMRQVPEQAHHPQRQLALAAWRGVSPPLGITLAEHRWNQRHVQTAFASCGIEQALFLDPAPYCFDDRGRSWVGSVDHSYYRDEDHLSDRGAAELLRPLLAPVVAQALPLQAVPPAPRRENETAKPR